MFGSGKVIYSIIFIIYAVSTSIQNPAALNGIPLEEAPLEPANEPTIAEATPATPTAVVTTVADATSRGYSNEIFAT